MKTCTKCKQIKPEAEFGRHKKTKDGLRCNCKSCENKYMKTYYNETPQGRLRRLRENARKDNIPVELTQGEFTQWFNNRDHKCFYCHAQLECVYGRHWHWNGLTLDRLVPNEPYKIGNIVLSCRRCNIIKGHWFTKDQMLEIATKYLRS